MSTRAPLIQTSKPKRGESNKPKQPLSGGVIKNSKKRKEEEAVQAIVPSVIKKVKENEVIKKLTGIATKDRSKVFNDNSKSIAI